MSLPINQIQKTLDEIKKVDETGFEYWSARELMVIVGYLKWERFLDVIDKAKESCKSGGNTAEDNFFPAPGKSSGGRPREDFFLTRYACYLISMNGDPRKVEIGLAQLYFATQARKQELLEKRQSEDKRMESRNKLKKTEKKIQGTLYERGIKLPVEFATFKDRHIQALYGGINTQDLKKKKGIDSKRALADFDTNVELRAKDFALAMTDHNIKENNLTGKIRMTEEVVKNSKATRAALISRNIIPEKLKKEEDIKIVEKKRRGEVKKLK